MNNSQFSIFNSQFNYDELSELDKLCVGADGWSADSFREEAQRPESIILAAYDGDTLAGMIAGFTAAENACTKKNEHSCYESVKSLCTRKKLKDQHLAEF